MWGHLIIVAVFALACIIFGLLRADGENETGQDCPGCSHDAGNCSEFCMNRPFTSPKSLFHDRQEPSCRQ